MFKDCDQNRLQFIIRPNSSLSWRGNQIFFLSLFCLSFGIAGVFAWLGLWLILPFAGFEMLVLGIVLYLCWRKTSYKEIIVVEEDKVIADIYVKKHKISYTFPRYWVQIVLKPAVLRGYPNTLYLRSHGCQVEIGRTLRNEEKESLAGALNKAIPVQTFPSATISAKLG